MGQILSSRVREDSKIVYEVLVTQNEARNLKGYIDNIHVFSEDACEIPSQIAGRGRNSTTTYLLIPKDLRKNIVKGEKIVCQRIETPTRDVFVFVMDKVGL